ncbi:hypothetical protein MKW98_007694 [Papaver atlanticum]|uniref:Uncharacterized protein n=1 Tax=Papaver atlanticum TaxID=357466 RepID=A0AAD4S423_9MAGN|nr:hypothetical protein MKW98_007694 [Papaver atlanticum]
MEQKLQYWRLIHLRFKDVILPRILDESTNVNLSSIIQGNNIALELCKQCALLLGMWRKPKLEEGYGV